VRARAASLGTPVLFGLLGAGRPDLTETAAAVVQAAGGSWAAPEHWAGQVRSGRPGGALRGLFVGGTLCDEAMLVASAALGRVTSNIPLEPSWAVGDDLASDGHTMLDFGDDRLTRGRPHPMIDGGLRIERLLAETEDPTTGVLLLDVVLGLGSADDPAAELVPALHAARDAGVPVVVSVTGTRDDPQGLRQQVAALHGAGAWVHLSNAAAARCALDLLGDPA
jgi:FdrA protein